MGLERFSSQADAHLLRALEACAEQEGKSFDALVNEAFADLLEKRYQGLVRPQVMAYLEQSFERYDTVYRHLSYQFSF